VANAVHRNCRRSPGSARCPLNVLVDRNPRHPGPDWQSRPLNAASSSAKFVTGEPSPLLRGGLALVRRRYASLDTFRPYFAVSPYRRLTNVCAPSRPPLWPRKIKSGQLVRFLRRLCSDHWPTGERYALKNPRAAAVASRDCLGCQTGSPDCLPGAVVRHHHRAAWRHCGPKDNRWRALRANTNHGRRPGRCI
jgi:hypothetical protein